MKIVMISFLLILTSMVVYGQDADFSNREVWINVVNKRERPIRGIIVQSLNTGQAGFTDRSGLFLFENMSDSDSISVMLSRFGETVIPVSGMDSIVVMLRSARLYSYTGNEGQGVYIEKRDRTEPNTLLDVPKLLEQSKYSSLSELLQGRVAGLDIRHNAMTPGGATTATIRGERSFLGSNEPLVVVDGIVVGTLGEANSFLNVNDIKTIEVQKSAAEWGFRGANGVILINTK